MDQRRDNLGPNRSQPGNGDSAAYDAQQVEEGVESTGSLDREFDRLRTDIEETEARLSETLQAIQDKLSLDQVLKQMGERVQQAAVGRIQEAEENLRKMGGNIGENAIEAIKEDPIPVALLGMGIGWVVLQSLRGSSDRESRPSHKEACSCGLEGVVQSGTQEPGENDYEDASSYGLRGKLYQSVDKGRETVGEVGEKLGSAARQINEGAKDFQDTFQHRAQRAHSGIAKLVEEKPLAVGLVALAVGAVTGLAVSGTFRERGLLSRAFDSLARKAGELLDDIVQEKEETAKQQPATHGDEAGHS